MVSSVDFSSKDGSERKSVGEISKATYSPQSPTQDVDSVKDKGFDNATVPNEPTEPAKPPPAAASPPPDGGIIAWSTVLGGFCIYFCSFGWINTIGAFQEFYQTDYLKTYSASEISWIASIETFVVFVLGPICGKIFDSYGPRYLILVGSVFHVAGILLLSWATEYYQILLCQGICSPLGVACILYSAISSVSSWFSKHRALAMGIMTSGSSFGGIVWPILIHELIPHIGFPWTVRVLAISTFVLLLIANVTVRSRMKHVPSPFRPMDSIRPLGERTFGLLTLSSFFIMLAFWLPITFVNLQALDVGVSTNLASYMLPILNAGSVFGRIIPGWVGDHLGRFNVMVVMCYAAGIVTLALWIPADTPVLVIIFAALYGFTSGAFVGMVSALIAQISEPRFIGLRNGTLYCCVSVACLVGNPIGGALLGSDDSDYTNLQIFAGVTMLVGSTIMVASRLSLSGFKLAAKV